MHACGCSFCVNTDTCKLLIVVLAYISDQVKTTKQDVDLQLGPSSCRASGPCSAFSYRCKQLMAILQQYACLGTCICCVLLVFILCIGLVLLLYVLLSHSNSDGQLALKQLAFKPF